VNWSSLSSSGGMVAALSGMAEISAPRLAG